MRILLLQNGVVTVYWSRSCDTRATNTGFETENENTLSASTTLLLTVRTCCLVKSGQKTTVKVKD